jgi:predicted PurR-regulated permease PerM
MGNLIPRSPIFGFFLACFVGSIVFLAWLMLPFLAIVILGAVVSSIFHPLYRAMITRFNIRPWIASTATCILIFFILFLPVAFFISSLAQQAFGLYQMARTAVISDQITMLLNDTQVLEKANAYLSRFNFELTGDELKRATTEVIRYIAGFLYDQSKVIASNTLNFVVNFILVLLVCFFLLIDGNRLAAFVVDLSPLPAQQERMLITKFKEMSGAILLVNGIGGVIQGLVGGLLFWSLGFQSAFLWGVIMGLLAFLPILGIGLVFMPAAVFLLLKGNIGGGIVLVIVYMVLTGGIEYLLKPRLVGHRMKMHPLLVFFAVLGGLRLFGILGIIYGPLIVTAFLTLAEIYRTNYQQFVETREAKEIGEIPP